MKQDFIKNSPLFGELTDDEQRAIGKRMRLEEYAANEMLFIKDGESEALYLIKEGWVKFSDGPGRPVMASLGPGSLLGEADFFLGRPYTMMAQSSSRVTVWSLNQQEMTNLIAERPELGFNLGLAFGQGIVQFQQNLSDHLAQIPFLQDLSPRERGLVARFLSPQRYYTGETLYRSGDSPTGLFFIEKGSVRLLGDTDDDYTELGYGEVFGEMAVVSGKPHSNTAQAVGEVMLWQLSPVDFNALTQTNPSIKTNLTRNLRARLSASDQAYAMAIVRRIPLFSGVSRDALNDVTRMLLLRHVPTGEIIFSQGDAGDAMYIIDSGSVDIISDTPGKPRELKHRLTDSDVFGETALLTGKTRDFTAHALTDTNLWCLYRTDFDNLLVKHPQISVALSQVLRDRLSSTENYSVEAHLQKIALQGGLSRTQLDELSVLLQPRRYQGASTIYYEGSAGDEMYFIERGQVERWATTMQGPVLLETLGQGDYFGEIALLSGRSHPETVYALIETDIWTLTKVDFDNFLQRYPNLGVLLSRILSERMEDTMQRLRGTAPRRGLPAPSGNAAPSGGATPSGVSASLPSRSMSPYATQPAQPSTSKPQYPVSPGGPQPTSRQFTVMPPVPVRPVAPPRGSSPSRSLPARAYSTTQTMPPTQYNQSVRPGSSGSGPMQPVTHSQPTQAIRPTPYNQPGQPAVHSQHTQAMPPVQSQHMSASRPASKPIHAQQTQGIPRQAGPQSPPKPKRRKRSQPRRKVKKQKAQPQTPAQSVSMPGSTHQRPNAAPTPVQSKSRPTQKPAKPQQKTESRKTASPATGQPARGQKPRKKKTGSKPVRPPQQATAARVTSAVQAGPAAQATGAARAKARSGNNGRTGAKALQTRSASNRRLQRHRKSVSVWFAKRTWGAKLRLLFIVLLLIWLCGIGAPFLLINALASTFADEGALPGDERGAIQQISEDGVVGAVAVLPFVETATATPTSAPSPTNTPTHTSTPTNTPIPTSTPTPTLTPTPTETPTPVFTPTPTETPTPVPTSTRRPPTRVPETPTPEPTATPNVDFRVKSVRELTPCENRGKHHIFIKVEDANGQGINNVPLKIQWGGGADGHVVTPTETKTDLKGQLDPGRIDFAMFKGSYTVEVMGGTTEVAGPVTPDFGTNEACGEDVQANSLFHISFEVIFQRTY